MSIGVTVVLCTYNGRARLNTTLKCLAGQVFGHVLECELLVIDNNSSDGTPEFVDACWKKLKEPFPLKIIRETRPGKAYALESGYDHASYSYCITCDDDNWLNENYLQQAFTTMEEHPDVGILGGYSEAVFEKQEPAWFSEIATSFAVGEIANETGYIKKKYPNVWGAGMVIRKELWLKLRQVDFSFITGKEIRKAVGEDSELIILAQYLGYRIYHSKSLGLKHFMPDDRLSFEACKRMFQGFGVSTVPVNMYMFTADRMPNNENSSLRKFYQWQLIRIVKESIHVFVFGWGGLWKGLFGRPTKQYKNAIKLICQVEQLVNLEANKRFFGQINQVMTRLK